jgi:thymidylate synthase ThyX
MIKAEIVADSISSSGHRLTTFLLIYPRFIHSELMTHRAFSRNAASSRAIPVDRMIRTIEENPAVPVEWGTTQKGMQAGPPLTGIQAGNAETLWLIGLAAAVRVAKDLLHIGVHKQIANRVLEPWMHMTTLVTATEYANFFKLRAHPDAQPEFQELAYEMLEAYLSSKPQKMSLGGWHLPFITDEERNDLGIQTAAKVCTARCARTSYAKMDEIKDHSDDIVLHDRLLKSGHFSPFEHPAFSLGGVTPMYGNFRGWMQYRGTVEPRGQHTDATEAELRAILSRRPNRG